MGLDKLYQAYYTKSSIIVNFMINNLELHNNDYIFEPCAGDGVFIEEILKRKISISIDAFELNKESFKLLKNKFGDKSNIRIKQTDTLLDDEHFFRSSFENGVYDKVIANPPYGAWQDFTKRKFLKTMYPNLYVKESYSLFLYKSIELLKENGKLVFIIPDTYLNLHMHKNLRKYLLRNTIIQSISIFPSSFFPGVNFGYANLSIITLQKSYNYNKCLNNKIKIFSNFKSINDLDSKKKYNEIKQVDILNNKDYAFLISNNEKINKAIINCSKSIADVANCVTGFYSGNDKEFLKVKKKKEKNNKRYEEVDLTTVDFEPFRFPDIIKGLPYENSHIPIVKGGNIKYLKPNNWFMRWDKKTVDFFKTNKKSRFQNSRFYFLNGIAVPMVSSKQITASLLENRLFDQSIVGVFPKDTALLYYLLAFFNSPTCNKIIRTINPSANNSANYLKKIPFINPQINDKNSIDKLVSKILTNIKESGEYDSKDEKKLHHIIEDIYGF